MGAHACIRMLVYACFVYVYTLACIRMLVYECYVRQLGCVACRPHFIKFDVSTVVVDI